MATEVPKCCLGLNPDISGIGVRVALYVQILIGWIVSVIWPDEFAKNARTAYMTAIALIIAAFIQNRTQAPQDLSLLDAIVVSMITTMMITFAISSSPTRSETKKSKPDSSDNAAVNTAGNSGNDNNNDNDNNNNDNSTNDNQEEKPDPNASFSRFITQFAFVPLWAGWCFNLWQDPLHFGFKKTLPDCPVNESVTIVLFGRNIKATDERMRVAALVFVSVGVIIAFGSLFMSLEGLFKPFMRPLRVLLRVPIDQYITWHAKKWPEKKAGSHDELIMTFIRRGLQALSFATLIFLIVETELTIKRNDTLHATTQWSYGQTIAMILLLQQIMDVSSTSLEKCAERKEKKARKKKQQPQTTGTTSPVSMSTPAHGQAPGSVIPPSPKPSTIPPSPNSAIPSLPGGTANTPNQRA